MANRIEEVSNETIDKMKIIEFYRWYTCKLRSSNACTNVREWDFEEAIVRGDEFHGQSYVHAANQRFNSLPVHSAASTTTLTDRNGIQLNHLLRDTATS